MESVRPSCFFVTQVTRVTSSSLCLGKKGEWQEVFWSKLPKRKQTPATLTMQPGKNR